MTRGVRDVVVISLDKTRVSYVDAPSARDLVATGKGEVAVLTCEACGGKKTGRGGKPCWHCEGTGVDPVLEEEVELAEIVE